MSKTIFHYPELDKTPLSEKVVYNFIIAAELLSGVMEKCKDCEYLKVACDAMHESERNILNENKMD